MPKVRDAEVDAFIKRLVNRIERKVQESEDAEANGLELDYVSENLRGELETVVVALRSLLQ